MTAFFNSAQSFQDLSVSRGLEVLLWTTFMDNYYSAQCGHSRWLSEGHLLAAFPVCFPPSLALTIGALKATASL